MTIGYKILLTQGGYSLDLTAGRYATDWTPPTASEVLNISSGTSANLYDGGKLISRRGENMSTVLRVRVMGLSIAETERGVMDIKYMLSRGGDEGDPLYLEWLPDTYVPYKPIWGQNGWKRLEIISGIVTKEANYGIADVRSRAQFAIVDLVAKPYILGLKQELAEATGGIMEWDVGGYGIPWGLIAPEATTNLITNPVFSGNAWNADWGTEPTADVPNYDKRFILFGSAQSMRAPEGTYTQALTLTGATTYTISAYVKRYDGAAVTATDVKIHYDGSAISSTYRSLGDGWYLVYASVTGSGAAGNVGITTQADANIYFTACQCEQKAYPTPLACGDFMGCAWSGTAHASNSARTAPEMTAPILDHLHCTVRVVMKMECDQTSGDFTIFDDTLVGYFLAADDKFYLTDGTNTISSAAQTWSIGDVICLHFVWGIGRLEIYKNGASIASGSTFDPNVNGIATVNILSDATPAKHLRGVWMDLTSWGVALTTAEVLADYSNISQLGTDRQRIGWIPWAWDSDGGGTALGYASYNDLCVAGGIPGNVAADTLMFIDTSEAGKDLYIGINDMPYYSGLTDSGINYIYRNITNVTSIDTTGAACDTGEPLVINRDQEYYLGKALWFSVKLQDAGSNLTIAPIYDLDSQTQVIGTYQPVTADGTDRYYIIGPLKLLDNSKLLREFGQINLELIINLYLFYKRSSGVGANVTTDYYQVIVGRFSYLDVVKAGTDEIYIRGNRAIAGDATDLYEFIHVIGDPVELTPNRINHIVFQNFTHGDSTLGAVGSIVIYIIPRWALM